MHQITSQDSTPRAGELGGLPSLFRWRLHILASPDPARAGQVLTLPPGTTEIGRQAAVAFDDRLQSRRHLRLQVGPSSVHVQDCQSRNGTSHGGCRIEQAVLGHGAVLRFGSTVAVLEADLGRALDLAQPTPNVPGRSELARVLRSELRLATQSPLPVLLVGETGTGKEHAAHEIHHQSGRRGPLVRFNVAAVPHNLFESELFGHVTGAFTGAQSARLGRVREAQGGCLVLDEIGELPLDLQPKLLRLLEEGRVRPVGANTDQPVDVRFIASTNADLDGLVRKHAFRADLLARLRGHVVHLPSLLQRSVDLLELADTILPLAGGSWQQRLTPEAVETLLLLRWPDNLRGLRGILQRAAALTGTAPIEPQHLPVPPALRGPEPAAAPVWPEPVSQRPSELQLRQWLAQHRGNIDAIASMVGRHRRQVYRWLDYAGIGRDEVAALRKPS